MRTALLILFLSGASISVGCSFAHPLVGVFPERSEEDSDSLVFLLAGLVGAAGIGDAGSSECVPAGTMALAVRNRINGRLILFRCNRDGTGCVTIDASAVAGQGNDTGHEPDLVFDPVNNRLLVTARNSAANDRLGLFRCNPDGTGCMYADLTSGNSSGRTPSSAVDLVNQRLVTATRDSTGGVDRLGIHRCNLDGTGCVTIDASAVTGQPDFTGFNPSLVLDGVDQRLYAAATNNSGALNTAGFYRCDLNAMGCTYTDVGLAAGLGSGTGFNPTVIHDQTSGRNIFIAQSQRSNSLAGVRCQEDGTGCVFVDVSAGESAFLADSILGPDRRIYTVASNPFAGSRAALWRCDIDGTNCIHANIGATLGSNTGQGPVVSADSSCAYAASINAGGGNALLYYYCRQDGASCQIVDLSAATGSGFGVSELNLLLL